MVASALDGVDGLGPAKREALIKHFGSLKQLSQASEEALQEVNGVGSAMAAKIRAHFEGQRVAQQSGKAEIPQGGINVTTGEVLTD